MITVVNKYKHNETPGDIYIGRGSILGNPYSHKLGGMAEFIVSSREEAIRQYRIYLANQILNKNADIINELRHIAIETRRSDVCLVCYCKPAKCHGDVIQEFVLRILSNTLDEQWLLAQKNS